MNSSPTIRSFVTLTDEAAEMFDYLNEDTHQVVRVKWARDPFIVQAVADTESGKVYVRLGRWLTATPTNPATRVPYSIIVGLEHVGATVAGVGLAAEHAAQRGSEALASSCPPLRAPSDGATFPP